MIGMLTHAAVVLFVFIEIEVALWIMFKIAHSAFHLQQRVEYGLVP